MESSIQAGLTAAQLRASHLIAQIPGGEQLQRDVPEQQQDTIPDDMVHNELPQGDASENGNGALKA